MTATRDTKAAAANDRDAMDEKADNASERNAPPLKLHQLVENAVGNFPYALTPRDRMKFARGALEDAKTSLSAAIKELKDGLLPGTNALEDVAVNVGRVYGVVMRTTLFADPAAIESSDRR